MNDYERPGASGQLERWNPNVGRWQVAGGIPPPAAPAVVEKAAIAPVDLTPLLPQGLRDGGMGFGVINEPFTGAWQRNIVAAPREDLYTFSAVYAATSLIANDIARLRLKLTERQEKRGYVWWQEVADGSPFVLFLRKPNRWQTRAQFVAAWMHSKLMTGNAYALKQRDQRGVVQWAFVLDPRLVTPVVTPDGGVYYRLGRDELAELTERDTVVPASEVFHDRMNCLWHPLKGVSPLYGCGKSATQGLRIQSNSETFFGNGSRPGGVITAPKAMAPETLERLKQKWESNYSANGAGRTAVLADGMKYEPFAMSADDSQLREQLDYTVEDVARAFHIPLHKLQSGAVPALASVGALNQLYFNDALAALINDFEDVVTDGLDLPWFRQIEFDLDDIMRLDPTARAETTQKAIGAGYMEPNKGREKENLPPVDGGDKPLLQDQYYPLDALDEKHKADLKALTAPPPAPAAPPAEAPRASTADEREAEEQVRALFDTFRKGLADV